MQRLFKVTIRNAVNHRVYYVGADVYGLAAESVVGKGREREGSVESVEEVGTFDGTQDGNVIFSTAAVAALPRF